MGCDFWRRFVFVFALGTAVFFPSIAVLVPVAIELFFPASRFSHPGIELLVPCISVLPPIGERESRNPACHGTLDFHFS
jgi:hypothetical protein